MPQVDGAGSRCLLLQRLARLGQEPRVLHCYDRLRREILQQRDLLFGERSDLSAVQDDGSGQFSFFAKRHPQGCANPLDVNERTRKR